MNSEGHIRYLMDAESPRADEVLLTQKEASLLEALPMDERQRVWQEKAFAEEFALSPRKAMRADARKNHGKSRFESQLAASAR